MLMFYISDMFLLPLLKTFLNSNSKRSKAATKPQYGLIFSSFLTFLFLSFFYFLLYLPCILGRLISTLLISSSAINADVRDTQNRVEKLIKKKNKHMPISSK